MGDLDRVKAIGESGVDLTIGSALDIFGVCRCGAERRAEGRHGGRVDGVV